MWELDCEEGWTLKNWCVWTVVLEKTLESPLDCKEIQPVHFEGDQSWVFFGGNDARAETPVFGHLMWRVDSLEKTLMLGVIGAGWKEDERGWDGWMASPTRWTWVWVNSGSWWWTGRPGMLQFMGSQTQTRLSDWIELNWKLTEFKPHEAIFRSFSADLFQGEGEEKVNLQYSLIFQKLHLWLFLKGYVKHFSGDASKTFAKQSDLKWYLPNTWLYQPVEF